MRARGATTYLFAELFHYCLYELYGKAIQLQFVWLYRINARPPDSDSVFIFRLLRLRLP